MRSITATILMACAFFCVQIPVLAATFSTDDLGVSITMNGEIMLGDAERLASTFLAIKPLANLYFYPNTLYLNSLGGDVAEAIRLADLVKILGISVATIPDGNGACVSSCFLIYAAALYRSASGIDTLKSEGRKGNLGPLGIHRPYLRVAEVGPVGAARQEKVMSDMRTYLVKANVSHSLIDKMMAHASNDIYWLNEEEVTALGSYSPGVEEQLIAKCNYSARRASKLSARDWIKSHQSGTLACVRDYTIKTYEPLKQSAVVRMRAGWRPWQLLTAV
jgi:hypothetical protein